MKKAEQLIEEQRQTGVAYLAGTLLKAQQDEVLELDELWSFVSTDKNRVWIWVALYRRTRQVVAWWYRPRDALSCQTLWDKITLHYKTGLCYTDFYASYACVVPADQHRPCPNQEGHTNHVEEVQSHLVPEHGAFGAKDALLLQKLLPHIQSLALFFVYYNKRAAKCL